jgi:dihydroxyacetone kinase
MAERQVWNMFHKRSKAYTGAAEIKPGIRERSFMTVVISVPTARLIQARGRRRAVLSADRRSGGVGKPDQESSSRTPISAARQVMTTTSAGHWTRRGNQLPVPTVTKSVLTSR